ncbi:hypothetical protein RB195_007928 [Necator americanus]
MNTMWRDTAEDTVVGPYCIAQGTPVGAQISLIMNDEKYFKDKHEFNPDRYFTDERLEQMVIPFSLGKRACPGESLAQAELYLANYWQLSSSLRVDTGPGTFTSDASKERARPSTHCTAVPYGIREKMNLYYTFVDDKHHFKAKKAGNFYGKPS